VANTFTPAGERAYGGIFLCLRREDSGGLFSRQKFRPHLDV
jgi:hypothetical protein